MEKVTGFTLIEIMIVVAIIAVISAITLPSLLRMREDTIQAREQADLAALYKAIMMYYNINRAYPKTLQDLKGYIEISKFEGRFEINPSLN